MESINETMIFESDALRTGALQMDSLRTDALRASAGCSSSGCWDEARCSLKSLHSSLAGAESVTVGLGQFTSSHSPLMGHLNLSESKAAGI